MRNSVLNFLIFTAILALCVSFLIYGLFSGNKTIDKSEDWVTHTQSAIINVEQLSTSVEKMLSAQRGYLITGDKIFLEKYKDNKAVTFNNVAELTLLTQGNPAQQSRLETMQSYLMSFSEALQERMNELDVEVVKRTLGDTEIVDTTKDDITRLGQIMLDEEYNLLRARMKNLDSVRKSYQYQLLIGLIVGSILLLIFNWYLLNMRRDRDRVEASLEDTQQRMKLAIEGTQDGIFDWNLKTDTVFYSKQFFAMLGDFDGARDGTTDDFSKLLHPEDKEKVWDHVQKYLEGELSEYTQEFRMRHSSGRYLWVQSRGKALFNKNGKPYRMVGGHTDITHNVKVRERLTEEKNLAEKANQAKTDFLAHMSHEIRTPLTAITGIAEIFARNIEGLNDKQKKLVRTLNSSAIALRDLITDILDFSKIESGQMDIVADDLELTPFCEEIISIMAVKASEKDIRFSFEYKELKNLTIHSDKIRLRQILINLIGNAIKFTDEGSVKVTVSIDDEGTKNMLSFKIVDTGVGIPADRIDAIFERFKQADDSVSRKFGGTGLGLPISRKLARLMGGDITVISKEGEGSTFLLHLPLEKDVDYITNEDVGINLSSDLIRLNQNIQKISSPDNKVLLVDDYEGNITVLGFMLEEAGLPYDIVHNGLKAVEACNDNSYALILMDVQMPEMDGFSATQEIRALEKKSKKRTPIIGMTAHALVADKDKCIEAGMDAYLSKPIDEIELKKNILKFLS